MSRHDVPARPPLSGTDADRARTTRRRIAFVVVGVLLAVIFIGGYVFGLMRHL